MTHAEIKEGQQAEIHQGDEGITIQSKKGSDIHKNASETDPALKIDHNGTDVVKRSREIEAVENTGAEQQSDETKATEEPANGVEATEDAPVESVDDTTKAAVDDANIEKDVETALDEPDQDVVMESPKKNGNEKSAGEKRGRDDLEDLEAASPAGEKEAEVDAESTGDSGVKKHKTEHSESNDVAVLTGEEAIENAPVTSHIDENIKKVEAEEPATAAGAGEGEGAVPA